MSTVHYEPTPSDPERRRLADSVWQELSRRQDPSRLGRIRGMLEVWSGRRPAPCYAEQSAYGWGEPDRPMFFMPDLPDKPWLDPDAFVTAGALRDRFPAIRAEARQLVDGTLVPPPYGLASDADGRSAPLEDTPDGWREWRLWEDSERLEERCRPFPVTTGVLEGLFAESELLAHVAFLAMRPGTELPRHVDWSNWWVALWLCLETPEGCAVEVAGQVRELQAGDCFCFSTGHFHRTWNRGDSVRLVLSSYVLHPALTTAERQAIVWLRSRLGPESNFVPAR